MHRVVALLLLLPTLVSAQTRYASESLNMRAGASDRARVLASIAAGASMDVRDCDRDGGEWCLVVFGGQRGFVEARLLDAEQSRRNPSPLSAKALVSPQGDPNAQRSSLAPNVGEADTRRSLTTPRSSTTRAYHRGPRGGCYTFTASGNKRYVDRSLCN